MSEPKDRPEVRASDAVKNLRLCASCDYKAESLRDAVRALVERYREMEDENIDSAYYAFEAGQYAKIRIFAQRWVLPPDVTVEPRLRSAGWGEFSDPLPRLQAVLERAGYVRSPHWDLKSEYWTPAGHEKALRDEVANLRLQVEKLRNRLEIDPWYRPRPEAQPDLWSYRPHETQVGEWPTAVLWAVGSWRYWLHWKTADARFETCEEAKAACLAAQAAQATLQPAGKAGDEGTDTR